MKVFIFIMFFFSNSISPLFQKSEGGYCIKTKSQAIKFAKKQFVLAYGQDILLMKPFIAKLIDNKVWMVKGTKPNDILGGIPYIEIQKNDCKILKLYHTK